MGLHGIRRHLLQRHGTALAKALRAWANLVDSSIDSFFIKSFLFLSISSTRYEYVSSSLVLY
uniref:Uncharacterized protein n=1 Tax=Manihot esculenta TaxID=3983 RepID=A0A2C9VLC7_MANES